MEDITLRALRLLGEVDIILCEDTRKTKKLLTHHNIKAKVSSLHSYNEKFKSQSVLNKLAEGRSAALVTESGTPGISDPGNVLVRNAIEEGIDVLPVPGPSALCACISVSGLKGGKFIFTGFLPKNKGKREKEILEIKSSGLPSLIYESPKRIKATIEEIEKIIPQSMFFIGREMTKLYEEYLFGNASSVLSKLTQDNLRGEFCMIVHPLKVGGKKKEDENIFSVIAKELDSPASKTAKIISEKYGIPRKIAYNFIIEFRNKLKND